MIRPAVPLLAAIEGAMLSLNGPLYHHRSPNKSAVSSITAARQRHFSCRRGGEPPRGRERRPTERITNNLTGFIINEFHSLVWNVE